jgi:hypothetical protein
MHPDDLKAIWICDECKMKFVFHSDIEDHNDSTGHKLTEKGCSRWLHQLRHLHNNIFMIYFMF